MLAGEARELGLRPVGSAPTWVRVQGAPERALALRTAVAAYTVRSYAVPRPRGLLGEEHLRSVLAQVRAAQAIGGHGSFRLSAAGSGSAVMRRLAAEITLRTGLEELPDEGELLVRIHPGPAGWEVAARLTPRPLSARAWRVWNLPGALNATIAAAMIRILRPAARGGFLNLMCGSGTLLAERLLAGPARLAVGLDLSRETLSGARRNLAAAGVGADLVRADTGGPPFLPGAFDELCADLPYGARSGSATTNDTIYPAFLAGAAGVARPGARLAVISHDIRRLEGALTGADQWQVEARRRVFQKGYRPVIWLLRRRPA